MAQRSSDYELFSRLNDGYERRYRENYGGQTESGPQRMAADALGNALGLFGRDGRIAQFVTSPRGIATGGGLAALGGLLAAAQEFNNPDPARSGLQNAAAGIGSGLGTTGGAIAGGLAGSMIAPGIGTIIGSTLGATLGGASGKGILEMVAGLLEPTPEEKALKRAVDQARGMGRVQLELETQRLPLMRAAQEIEAKRQRDAVFSQALGVAMQQATAPNPVAQMMLSGLS